MEQSGVDDLYEHPRHPYTEGLLGSLPMPGAERPERLVTITGLPPDPVAMPRGCPFSPRCPYSDKERCVGTLPDMLEVAPGHEAACHFPLGADDE
jgi:oligopeptide transport system ATP-binding protein